MRRSATGRLAALVLISAGLAACGRLPIPTPPSGLSYPSPIEVPIDTAITPLLPTVQGTVSTYAVTPALPSGIVLDTTTGVISGTPTAATAQATYTVSASNTFGTTTFGLVLTVAASPGLVWSTGNWNHAVWQ